MKVLVTGAAGFIGAALVEALAGKPDVGRILAFDQVEPAAMDPKVESVTGNLAYAPMARSARLGFGHSAGIEEIVTEYVQRSTS